MKIKETKIGVIKLSDAQLLSLVADKLKGRILFPERVKDAKDFINSLTSSVL
ncbi:hypothetical protein [Pedobacter metabolipauper]|uniref:Uncharacterized protein n=1 Tax=Pedobacter metabolipauper TaxID=425513 RepID=A0A4R6T133_9SPHI|nr:hypothetical protein [Pedobacter metabolipauper]TDQ11051.1 hypothetical protein ATK78_0165 [Pedobacter metabolipauper]